MAVCTDDSLMRFGRRHYTFINQIFGDLTVREDIQALYPNAFMVLDVEPAGDGLEPGSMHHIINILDERKAKIGTWCSIHGCNVPRYSDKPKLQDLEKDENDTLCQSYTLLKYLSPEKPIPRGRKRVQLAMVNMYESLINNDAFLEKFESIDPRSWYDYTTDGPTYSRLNLTSQEIIDTIEGVLSDWKRFGYLYYVGNGIVKKGANFFP